MRHVNFLSSAYKEDDENDFEFNRSDPCTNERVVEQLRRGDRNRAVLLGMGN